MASMITLSKVVALGALIFSLVLSGSFAVLVNFNTSHITADPYWVSARATWYGAPTGAGPLDNGGACGFKNVNLPPFSAMTSCGNEPLFKDGKGCGFCYQIRCVNHPACSGNPETVTITDMNYYPVAKYHFDLSGTAFGAMAQPGRNDELRHAGIIDIQFKRSITFTACFTEPQTESYLDYLDTLEPFYFCLTNFKDNDLFKVPCNYPGLKVTFHVERGSNPNYFAVLVEFEDDDRDVVQVDLMEANSWSWTPMRESWGSIWRLDTKHRLTAPFSLRITNESGRTLVANQVIPANWMPNTFYHSNIQYQDQDQEYQDQEGPGVGLVISSAAGLDTKILVIIGLISLVIIV